MTYFPDLAPYAYGGHPHPGVVHVGWLDGVHPFSHGEVDARIVEKLKRLAKKPVELYRGWHICQVCVQPEEVKAARLQAGPKADRTAWENWCKPRQSNGEIRVTLNGVTYAAPVLIVHNIEEHGYLPPTEFLRAIELAPE